MRKTELLNCPQWLLDADTENENVEWNRATDRIDWISGDFRGGNFRGGNFRGESLNTNPLSLYGLIWNVYITTTMIHIGCQSHLITQWENFSDEEINSMEDRALDFWKQWKDVILSMAKTKQKES